MKSVFRAASVDELRSRWIRIEFSQTLRGQPIRPLLRLHRSAAPVQDHILPAAVLGRARWIGLAPKDLDSLEILTVSGSAEDIRVDSVRAVSEFQIARTVAFDHPAALPRYLYGSISGPHSRAVIVRSLLDLSPPERFDSFQLSRVRAYEPEGIDAGLRTIADGKLSISFIVTAGAGAHDAFDKTLESLARQIDPGFRLVIGLSAGTDAEAVQRSVSRLGLATVSDTHDLREIGLRAERAALNVACASSSEWVARLDPGDVLSSEAVLVLRDYIAACPQLQVLYADSVSYGAKNEERRPELKPDWSPAFLNQIDYVGRPCLFRRSFVVQAARQIDREHPRPWWAALKLSGKGRTRAEVGHLKRILLEHPRVETGPAPLAAALQPPALGPRTGRASIIIPTRDRVELLRRAVNSIIHHARDRDDYEVLIVDNGSVERETLAYLSSVEDGRQIRVLNSPGDFNYPDLVNSGAAAATGDVLILLNNDCEARDGIWLDAITNSARQADVGAVGAILLYEDGRVQHAGVTLGLGGEAGHRDRKLSADHPGNLRRLTAVHEVSAVTAACLAVERRKYLEIGGFDRMFAVAFNDVDFCLRLQERGYRNLLTPHAVLIHAESASRGQDTGPKRARFEQEAALFRDRWRPLIHDDPFFHPLFSTTRFNDLLG